MKFILELETDEINALGMAISDAMYKWSKKVGEARELKTDDQPAKLGIAESYEHTYQKLMNKCNNAKALNQ